MQTDHLNLIPDEEIEELGECVKCRKVKNGEVLFRKGEKVGEQLVFLLHGNLLMAESKAPYAYEDEFVDIRRFFDDVALQPELMKILTSEKRVVEEEKASLIVAANLRALSNTVDDNEKGPSMPQPKMIELDDIWEGTDDEDEDLHQAEESKECPESFAKWRLLAHQPQIFSEDIIMQNNKKVMGIGGYGVVLTIARTDVIKFLSNKTVYLIRKDIQELISQSQEIDLSNYRIIKKIGKGTFGTVFLAVDPENKPVAIKQAKF